LYLYERDGFEEEADINAVGVCGVFDGDVFGVQEGCLGLGVGVLSVWCSASLDELAGSAIEESVYAVCGGRWAYYVACATPRAYGTRLSDTH